MYFITSTYRGNNPINLELCTTFYKTSSGPVFGTQGEKFFEILFSFASGQQEEWGFNTEAERDSAFEAILYEVGGGRESERG